MEQNTRLALCDTSGLLKAIIDALSGKEGRYWMTVFKKALRKENPFEKRKWQIWKTIILDLEQLAEPVALLQSLKKIGFKTQSDVDEMVGNILQEPLSPDYDLVKITPEDLGFTSNAYIKEIYERAFEYDLNLCPRRMALMLRDQYLNQWNNESLMIAMHPIENTTGIPSIFNLHVNDSIFSIGTSNCAETSKYGIRVPFVFCIRK